MRIAQVCPRFPPDIGGVETHVYEIARRLARRFDVEVLTTDPAGRYPRLEEIDGITVRRFRSFAPSDSYYLSIDLYRFLRRHGCGYDIIHAHNYHALPALFAAVAESRAFIFTPHYHGRGHSFVRNILHVPYKLIGSKIFQRADAVICVSEFERRLILKDFGVSESKVHVIPNGINPDEFARVEKKRRGSARTILYVGRIEKYKGLDFVVAALRLLPDNFVLEVVGKGPYKSKIVRLAKRLGVANRVRFHQDLSRRELIEKYASADVLVLLSRHEAYGIVVAEALACKTPCVVANTSALSEWVDDANVFGIDYPIDVKELADLIERASEVEVRGVELPGWDDVARKIVELYEKLVDRV